MPLRPRIAVVTTSYPSGPDDPSGHFVAAEAASLARGGAQVVVLHPGEAPGVQPEGVRAVPLGASALFGWPGVLATLRRRPWRLLWLVPFVVAARRALRRLGPFDLVQGHWLVPTAWPLLAGCNGPMELIAHGSDVALLRKLPRWLLSPWGRVLRRPGVRLRCVSRQLAEALREAFGELAQPVEIRPCALALGAVPAKPDARAELHLAPGRAVLVVVGRLIATKRVEVALSAAELLPDVDLYVLGDGPERAALQARFPRVTFLGLLPRPTALLWLSAADVLLSASRLEGAPTAIREALALGTPVVAFPCGDLQDWARTEPLLHLYR